MSYNDFKVFISSKDILDDERSTVESALKKLKIKGLRIETKKWVATSNKTEYLEQLEKSDLVILIIDLNIDTGNDDDKYYFYVKEETEMALKDGKSVLAFFKKINNNNNNNIISKFVNDIQLRFFNREFSNCVELFDLVCESVQFELVRKYKQTPLVLTSKKDIYQETYKIISNFTYRLYLVQATPLILLGPRLNIKYEMDLFLLLKSLIIRQQKDKNIELHFIFDVEKIDYELENNIDDYNKELFIENIKFLKDNMNENLVVIEQSDAVPFVICDNYYLFGNSLKKNAYAILDCHPILIKELKRDLNRIVSSQKRDSGIICFQDILNKYN